MLTSTKNPKIQHIRKLQRSTRARRKDGLFIIEGVRLAEEALEVGLTPTLVLHTDELNQRGQEIVDGFRTSSAEVVAVAPHVMQVASDTQAPQGILAVMGFPTWNLPTLLDFVVVLDGIRDPGNLGTLLRTALAAGVQAVFLPPGAADVFAPKVVRAGMGAHFQLPVLPLSWDEIEAHLAALSTYVADSAGGKPYYQANFAGPVALVIGGEADGVGTRARELATGRIQIPMPGSVESLNAAAAGAVLIFEVVRQRS